MSLMETAVYSTVRMHIQLDNGEADATGTLCWFTHQGMSYYLLVTNKHVIEGAKTGTLYFTKSIWLDPQNTGMIAPFPLTGQVEKISLDDFEKLFIIHPNSDIDLAVLPLNHILYNKNIFLGGALNLERIPSLEQMSFPAGEQILAIGYPYKIYDSVNNLPIVRNGITATSPRIDYKGKKEFLIDAAVHEGLSGAPVFLFSKNMYNRFNSMESLVFIGVISGGIEKNTAGKLIAEEKQTAFTASTRTSIPINLGIVIKSSCILDFRQLIIPQGSSVPIKPPTNNTHSKLPSHIINLFNRELSTSFNLTSEGYLLITALRDYLENLKEKPYYDQAEKVINAIKYSNFCKTFRKALAKFNNDLDPRQVANIAVKELYENYPTCDILYLRNAHPVKNFVILIEKELNLHKP